jgi:hypothetical protein
MRIAMIAYLLAAWMTMGGLVLVSSEVAKIPGDISLVIMLVAAPVVLPIALLLGLGNWLSGYTEHNNFPLLCLGLLFSWVFCFAVLRLMLRKKPSS